MKQQFSLMKFDPATGQVKPYPSHADQWRQYHGGLAWLFNPWSGKQRLAGDVGSDTFGQLILPEGEPIFAAANPVADALVSEIEKLSRWKHCMSYNDSYFGEPAGLVKRAVYQLDRLLDRQLVSAN